MLSRFFSRLKTAEEQPEPSKKQVELQEILPYVTVTVTLSKNEQGEDTELLIEDTQDFSFLKAQLKHWPVDEDDTNLVLDYVINADNPCKVGIGATNFYQPNKKFPCFHIGRVDRLVLIMAKDTNAKNVLRIFSSKYNLSSATKTRFTVGKEEPFEIDLLEASIQQPRPR